MEGHNIGIHSSRVRDTLRWLRNDSTNANLRLTSSVAIPTSPQDIGAISFTEHGIDVVDASGTPFLPRYTSGKVADVTIPRSGIAAVENGQVLIQLWEEVLTHLGKGLPSDSADFPVTRD